MPFDRRGALKKVHNSGRLLLDRAPRFLFLAAVILAAFAVGWRVGTFEIFPHAILFKAYKTARTQIKLFKDINPALKHARFVNVVPDPLKVHRFEFVAADALADPILVTGGLGHFAEYCPDHAGCLAVEYAGNGEVIHAYPYRPEEIEKTAPLVDFPYEQPLGFSMHDAVYPTSTLKYANGDLLVVFQSSKSFPFGQGVARIDRDGRPIWYRRDYSHHQPYIIGGDVALVPSLRIGEGSRLFNQKKGLERLQCVNPYLDVVHVIDGAGVLLKEIPIINALLESPYASILRYTDPCDPIHLNSVDELGRDVEGRGIGRGEIIVSLRNISAFAILDGDTYQLKRLIRGGFFGQHDVLHFEGSRFLMFDNLGREGTYGPSRLLMVDIANGTETTIFPNNRTPDHLRNLQSFQGGGISISPDRRRVIITFTEERKAVEIRISDGAVLSVFNSVHNVSDSLSGERKTEAKALLLQMTHYIERGGDVRHEH